jgi:uncharacterized caspase-like protein
MGHFMITGVGRLFCAFFAGRGLAVCALHAAMLAFTLLALLIAHPAPALADNKIALVVGNSLYRNVPALTNPVNDAADVAESLRRLGFSVKHFADLDYDGFRRSLIDFGQAAKTADKAVIFYAGHGVEIDGKNWLIPVDAEIKSEIDVYAEAINLETLIDLSVLPKVIGLVVLDACRNNPFANASVEGRSLNTPNSPASTGGAEKKQNSPPPSPAKDATLPGTPASGLAPVDVTDNVLVAFSAAAGTTASDGDGRNSPYSGALLRYVEKPGLEINYLFRDVHDDVLKATRNNQEPAVYGTLSKDEIYLKEGDARVASVDQEAAAEKLAWAFVRATNDIAVLRRFSAQFPSSLHRADITARLAQLEAAEKFAWDMVGRQHSASAYRAFLDIYPFGDHADEARVTLASLGSNPDDGQTINLPKPPEATYTLASADALDKPDEDSESIEKAWAVLKDSRDQDVTGRFAKKFPSLRHHRLPPGSDFGLRPVNSTEWMLTTANDAEVNRCFKGDAEACLTAIDKYPDYVQLRFQLCRAAGHLKPVQDPLDRVRANSTDSCMLDAVEDARARGYLVSAFTRSEAEERRNQEYRLAVSHVQQNVGNIVGNTVSNVVSNVVGNAAGIAAAAAAANAANAAGAAGTGAAFPAPVLLAVPLVRWNAQLNSVKAALGSGSSTPKATPVTPAITTNTTKVTIPGANAAGTAATNAASKASSSAATNAAKAVTNAATNAAAKAAINAASSAASKAATNAAANAASKAASNAASNAASKAASNAASRAAGNAASNAASKAASNAASKAAGNAASNAASKINIPSDIRLKEDIVPLGRTRDGLQIYRYRYIGDDTYYVGVMAQEVAERLPDAVTRGKDGYLRVDYARLGLTFMTFEEWSRRNASAVNN